MKEVFLLGPGYVGREIIDLLLETRKYHITTIVRREEAVKEFEAEGVKAVIGDLNHSDLITNLALNSDIVFHTATADHLPSAQAILDGITKRAEEGKETIYLHQSGASVLSDGSKSEFLSEKVCSDLRPDELDALPDDAPHRSIDLALLKTRKQLSSKAKIFIMMPPIIFGCNRKYGRLSIQIPTLARFAIKNKYAGYVGEGKSAWNTVHVQDLARAYLMILTWLESSPPEAELQNPYFFCESGEMTWKDLSATIGDALREAGKVDNAKATTIPSEQYVDLFGKFTPDVVGCNARHKAERVRELGWEPRHRDLKKAFVEEELPILLKETRFQASGLALA